MLKNIIKNNKFIYSVLIVFSFSANTYYGNLGVFPIDTFAFFDTGYNILIGRHPFSDIWVTTGPVVDYIQALFFKIFGLNWNSYIFHSSFINSAIVIFFYKTLLKFKLNNTYCFLYSIFFSILGYTISGTPFAYLHSYLFSLTSILVLFMCIKLKSKFAFFFLPIVILMAFFSMQNPASFFVIIISILLIYFFFNFQFFGLIYLIYGVIFSLVLFLIYLSLTKVSILDIWQQYFLFPLSIGEGRIEGSSIAHISLSSRMTLKNIFNHFKFINFYIFAFLVFSIISFYKKKISKEDLIINVTLILSGIFLIFNQLITSNQTYIFSFILFIGAFFHAFLNKYFYINKWINLFLITLAFFCTVKYHFEYNEKRKFMDLQDIDLKNYTEAYYLDDKLKNLKWINPKYPYSSNEEIKLLIEAKEFIKKDASPKMVITHYQFFSLLLEENLNIPNRWYTKDNNSYPLPNHKYFLFYKKHINKVIKKNSIENIYIIGNYGLKFLLIYFDELCFKEKKINQIFYSYTINKCN